MNGYRQRTGEQRLGVALALQEMTGEVAREGILRRHPDADALEVKGFMKLLAQSASPLISAVLVVVTDIQSAPPFPSAAASYAVVEAARCAVRANCCARPSTAQRGV